MHVAVALGTAVGTAALGGALLVGDSMRGSLRARALERLGRIECAMIADRFVHAELATQVAADPEFAHSGATLCPALLLRGSVAHAGTGRRANRVTLLGVDERFDEFSAGDPPAPSFTPPDDRSVVLNETLAAEIGAAVGDDVLVRLGRPGDVPTELLLGRRDETVASLRLTVSAIVPASGLGVFAVSPQQRPPLNAYLAPAALQRAAQQRGQINALFVGADGGNSAGRSIIATGALESALAAHLSLDDVGLRLRVDDQRAYISLESGRMLIEPAVAAAAESLGDAVGARPAPIITYLANTIELAGPVHRKDSLPIPYSVVAAVPQGDQWPGPPLSLIDGTPAPPLSHGEILLNEWAATALGANVGDKVGLSYYVTAPGGQLQTENATFALRGIVALTGPAADPGFTPEYRGITDVQRLSDWEPPFPVDLSLIRREDEAYWDEQRTTPKAFVGLDDGLRLWAREAERFGRWTAIRYYPARGGAPPPPPDAPSALAARVERELLSRLSPAAVGLNILPLRADALRAGAGSTDFGGLFIGLSLFLIASAAMLVALLYRLGVERRAGEIGLLLALGHRPRTVSRMFLGEGAIVAALGAAVGACAAVGYGWLMLAGLRTWWSAAVSAPFLRLYVSPVSLGAGVAAGFLVALLSITWSLRGLARQAPRALLAGAVAGDGRGRRRRRLGPWIAAGSAICAVIALLASRSADSAARAGAFFGSGAALLVAALALIAVWTGRTYVAPVAAGRLALVRLGTRNARRSPGRTLLTCGLIASATFVIAAIGAFRVESSEDALRRDGGGGGYALLGEADVPLQYDPDSAAGRRALGFSQEDEKQLAEVRFAALRLREGDETSCLNLYLPKQPRLLGAPAEFVRRGGFSFSASLAESRDERENPWLLLERAGGDGVIPVIGDANSVMWQLHSGLGKEITITDQQGRPVRLRFVALLKGSVLQGELIVSEEALLRLFPSTSGYGYFLIEAPAARAADVESLLEERLSGFGFDTTSTLERLAALNAVQNTYLSTFQVLGGLGLVLGTLGLAAVQLRNIWERRRELAVLRALGYPRRALGRLVLSEHALLLLLGLGVGCVAASIAVSPQLVSAAGAAPWRSVGLTLAAVVVVGMLSGLIGLRTVNRAPLLKSLRSE